MKDNAALYLIPVTLGETEHRQVLPTYNRDVIRHIRHFIVENIRTARRFLKKEMPEVSIDEMTFYPLNKHTPATDLVCYLQPLADGIPIAILSEAGCPAIADPGAAVVEMAQRMAYTVIPLVGPSSILLSLMASGFNGQSFAFNGYLPIDATERIYAIRKLESRIYAEDQTQLFIETPYRNNTLAAELLRLCRPSTRLCIASDISCPEESIRTRAVKDWEGNLPDLSKRPTIFLLYK